MIYIVGRSLRSIVPTDYAEMISGHYQKGRSIKRY